MQEPLRISIEGATPEELARGLAAARHVFEGAGVTALECAAAASREEWLDIAGVGGADFSVRQLRERGAPADEIAAAAAGLAELKREPDLHDLTDREVELINYWEGADRAAVRACCAGWPNPPTTARLTPMSEEEEAELLRMAAQVQAGAGACADGS